MTVAAAAALPRRHAALEQAGLFAVYGVAGALQFSIAAAQILLTVAVCCWIARVLFGRRDRTWSALVMPALAVALPLTFSRSAEVGVCAAVALLLFLKDRRLLAVLPVLAAVFFVLAPARVTDRFESIFNLKDP